MKGQEKKINWATLQWIVPSIVLLIFLVVTLINYSKKMEVSAQTKALDRISKQAVSAAGYYDGIFKVYNESVAAFADSLMKYDGDIFAPAIVGNVSDIVEEFNLQKAFIVKSDFTAVDNEGVMYMHVDGYEGIGNVVESKLQRYLSTDPQGNPVVLLSAPICSQKEWKGNVIYVYKPSELENIINSSTYSYAYVLSDRRVGECCGSENDLYTVGDNISDVLTNTEFVDGSLNLLEVSMKSKHSGMVSVKRDATSPKEYIIYQPIGDLGAYIFVLVNENQVKYSIAAENKETKDLVVKVIVSIGIFLTIIIGIYLIDKYRYAMQSKELKDKAETDLLTDLYNKVSTENKITEYLLGEGKDKINMMCVLDIDNFKKINDTMGHAFGDEVIATLGKRIKSEFRVTDIVGRIGGDEFVIFLKDLKSDDVILRESERISNFFKDFQVGSYTKYSPTASIGAAIYPRDARDYESLYKSADTALYKAKKRGKNQLAFYRDMPEQNSSETK